MIKDQKRLALSALTKALLIRKELGYKPWEPICIYDLAKGCGVEVMFQSFPSMEGMYSNYPSPIIIVGSERPAGRQAYNCAHELGHHVFNHGVRIDELIDNKNRNKINPEEFLANCFAGFLLMPKVAIEHAFRTRDWDFVSLTPRQIYTVAGNFGVGYTTLIHHMMVSLKILKSSSGEKLLKVQPKQIREEVTGESTSSELIIVDDSWRGRAIDIHVGDSIFAPFDTATEGEVIELTHSSARGEIIKGITPGVGRLINEKLDWTSYVRVSRKNYVGYSQYMHLEDPDDHD